MAASPAQISLPGGDEGEAVPKKAQKVVVWTEECVETELSPEEVVARCKAMRGKRIQPQHILRQWFEEAPWRLGPVRAFHPFTDTERQYILTNRSFWTLKRWKRLFGCLLETDNSQKRRLSRRAKKQPTRSARDCFINSFSRNHGILHTTAGGETTAPGVEMANILSAVGRQEVDTYDRGNRILWKLSTGQIVCTTKRALTSVQAEDRLHVSAALVACKSMVKDDMRRMRAGGKTVEKGKDTPPATKARRRKKRQRSARRMSTADAAHSVDTVAMFAVPSGEGPKKKPRRAPARNPCAALGISLVPRKPRPANVQPKTVPQAVPQVETVMLEEEDEDSSSEEEGGEGWSSSSDEEGGGGTCE